MQHILLAGQHPRSVQVRLASVRLHEDELYHVRLYHVVLIVLQVSMGQIS